MSAVPVERASAAHAEARQRQMAGALLDRGLVAGDRVAVVAGSSIDLLCMVLGALRRGIVPVLLNPALSRGELAALLDDADPQLVVVEQSRPVGAAEPAVGRVHDVVALSALVDGPEVELAPWPRARPMHYTSGTTGVPKGVWSGLLDDDDARALAGEEEELWGFSPEDVHLVCSPLHHSAPIRFAGGTWLAGGDVVLLRRFDADLAAATIDRERPTTAFMVPAHLQRLFARPGAELPDLSSFRLLAHAGAHCPEPLKRHALDVFPTGTVWEFYGSTEGQFTACSPDDWLARPGTVGRARQHRALRIAEADEPEGSGQIWCRAPSWARFEYWRDPAKTALAWHDDEFTVGDLGRLDADGFLYLDGRRDDLMITGGVNVYPAEVERVLHAMPGVRDLVVFGVPDERWGHMVTAAVTGDVEPAAVIAWARDRLAAYKCPKRVLRLHDIPLGPTGKIQRSRLAEDLGLA